MIPTVAEILTYAADLCGDPDRDVYTDKLLTGPFGQAFREYYRVARAKNLPRINKVAYYNVPAYTTSLAPATASLTDFGQPTRIWERGSLTTATITASTSATPIVLTVDDATGFVNNYQCQVDGVTNVPGRINETWFITVSGLSVTLVGSTNPNGVGTTGTLTYSPDKFVPVTELGRAREDETPSVELDGWEWRDGVMRFPGSSQQRQIKIEYEQSGDPPVTGAVGIDDSKDFFATRAAGIALSSRGEVVLGTKRNKEALGKEEEPDGNGGLLGALIQPAVQQKSRVPKQPMRYRRRRQHHLGYIR